MNWRIGSGRGNGRGRECACQVSSGGGSCSGSGGLLVLLQRQRVAVAAVVAPRCLRLLCRRRLLRRLPLCVRVEETTADAEHGVDGICLSAPAALRDHALPVVARGHACQALHQALHGVYAALLRLRHHPRRLKGRLDVAALDFFDFELIFQHGEKLGGAGGRWG